MSAQAATFGYGKITFDNCSTGLSVFHVTAPWVRVLPKFPARGKGSRFAASDHPEINGQLQSVTQEMEDNTLLLLQNSQKQRGMPVRDGGVFFRTREKGALYAITATLQPNRSSLLGQSFMMFQGRGELVSVEELQDHGIVVPQVYAEGFMRREEVEGCFDIREMAPALEQAPTFQNVVSLSGDTVRIQRRGSRRRIKVR